MHWKLLQKAFGKSGLLKTRAYEWRKDFKRGPAVIEDMSRPRQSSASITNENVKKSERNCAHHLAQRKLLMRLALPVEPCKIDVERRLLTSWFLQRSSLNSWLLVMRIGSTSLTFVRVALRRWTEAEKNASKELNVIPLAAYQQCMDKWVKRWHTYVASDLYYFEGDEIIAWKLYINSLSIRNSLLFYKKKQ